MGKGENKVVVVGSEGRLLDERWKLGVGYRWSGGGDLMEQVR